MGLSQRTAMLSLPTATVVVAMSSTYGSRRPDGAATLMGLVPIMGLRPKVGAMATKGELVKASPIIPRSRAIMQKLAQAPKGLELRRATMPTPKVAALALASYL